MSISAENLNFSFGRHMVLKDLSFRAENGELCAVLGPNGVGKTTLFRCILGMLKRYSGTICIDGEDTKTFSARELANRVAYIPQGHGQTFPFSVEEMILMGTNHRLNALSVPGKTETEAAEQAMERMGIAQLRHKVYTHLSGGEQQLVLVARALAQGSRTLLMDEPTSALDYGNQSKLMEQAHRLAEDGYCVVLSTHTPQHALWYADTALAMLGGKFIATGKPEQVITEELIEKLYGVKAVFYETEDGRLICPAERKNKN